LKILYKNKINHVIALCKEKPPRRHLERSETESKDLLKLPAIKIIKKSKKFFIS